MSLRILITGASVAGNAAAWWLTHHGFDVTVVERAPAFRDGGQNVDVRGAGRQVLRLMGLEQAVRATGTGERGMSWVNESNKAVARFDVADLPNGPTAELEILRGDLARIIYEAAGNRAAYRFGDRIEHLETSDSGADVSFQSGRHERYDLVIIAEGVGSTTRDLVFPGENRPRWMDMTLGYFTIPRGPTDTEFARWYNAPGGRSIMVRPDQKGTTRVALCVSMKRTGSEQADVSWQKAFFRERFAGAGWETPRVLEGMDDAEDFYFDVLRQVKMERWSSGRVVVTGDAAWCVTPLGGIGAALSILGGYLLAGELSKTTDVAAALGSYERVMRPFAEDGQSVPKIVPRLMHPRTRLGIAVQHGVLNTLARPLVRDAFARVFGGGSEGVELPTYKRGIALAS